MSSTALISCRMKIDLYLLNCYPLNPSILQTMSFVNSTCLKISKIIFCFTTIRWKNEGNIFTSLKDVTSSNAQYCACIFVCLFFFYSFYDYYLFTCFSMAINYFCDLNSALSLSVQNTRIRKTLFFSEQDMLHPAITESIRMNLHRELYCTNTISLQVINSIYPSFNMIQICFWSSSH